MTTVLTELPLFTDLDYVYGVNIEGQSKQIRIYWNSRCMQWHMDLRNEDQTEIAMGVPLVVEYPILIDYRMAVNGLSGYFVLVTKIMGNPPDTTSDSSVLPQFYSLLYVYITE